MDKQATKLSCWRLFISSFTLSAFTLGGGYVMISLMHERYVEKLKWINADELAEIIALGQSGPGAMVVNSVVMMGYRLLGFKGAICALLGTALPPLIILSLVCKFYEAIRDNNYVSAAFKGMRSGIAAVIADIVVTMAAPYMKKDQLSSVAIMAAAFLVSWFFDINVVFIIIGCGTIGAILGAVQKRRGKV